MPRTRFIVTIALTMLVAGGPALAQAGDGELPPPGDRQRQTRAVRIDPQRDEALQAIWAAVEPTKQQEASILAQYTKLRTDQRAVMRDALGAVRGEEGRRDGQREFNRENMRKARELAREMIDALNTGFLESCRRLLRDDQHEAWDACASQLDLRMNRRRGRRGAGRAGAGGGGPKAGEAAPAFELTGVAGETVTLASLRGKPVVIEFGSYTCPVFRRQVEPLQALQARFGDNVHWVLVYTKEAHPVDGHVAGINQREGIEVPQHVSFEKRLEAARLCRQKLNLKARVLVDGIRNKVTEAYGGHPNRGFVIDADGTVVSRQNWINADRTREALERLFDVQQPVGSGP